MKTLRFWKLGAIVLLVVAILSAIVLDDASDVNPADSISDVASTS